ncbi:MAG TPA: hypothetical protein VES21_15610 [Nocardioidaceae bacterium]|nr:hypothetical protein [Nocardioidaceae bacterium]
MATLDECWPAVVVRGIIVHWHRPSADCNNGCHVVANVKEIRRALR